MNRNYNIIGNPKRKRFSFGYNNFLGEFGLIDLFITFISIFLLSICWIFLSTFVSLFLNFVIITFWILLVKQFGNEKSYDFLISWVKYLISYKKITSSIIELNNNEVIFKITNGHNLNLLQEDEIDSLIFKFNSFVKFYDGDFKIVKYNSYFEIDSNIDFLEENISKDENENIKTIQKIFLKNLKGLKTLKLNNEIYFVFKNPTKSQLEIINNFDLDLNLELIDNEKFKENSDLNFKTGRIKISEIYTEINNFIVCFAKFKRSVNFKWLGNLVNDSNANFILEINSPNISEQEKIIKRLNKQKINFKTKNHLEEIEKNNLKNANFEVMENIILSKEELKMISLTTVFYNDFQDNNNNIQSQYKNFELKNYHYSGFKLIREYFNQSQSLEKSYQWKNGIFPTTNETIANSYPFINQNYIDKQGIFLGYIDDRYPFIYDSWNLDEKTNLHSLVLGSSGSGKTTLMKYIICSEIINNKGKQIIIDPHNEFGDFSSNFNGSLYDIDKIHFNPLKFYNLNETNFEEKLKVKILSIKEFLKLIYKNELNWELNKQIQQFLVYIEECFYGAKEELLLGEEFCFDDLEIKNFGNLLNPIIKGVFKIFNQKETLNLEGKIIIFQAKKLFLLEEEYKNTLIFLLMNRINELIYENQNTNQQINLYIDEARKFLINNFLMNKISSLFSEARKFNTKITIATQNVSDLYNGTSGDLNLANIFANISNMFIGYLKNDQRKLLDLFLENGKAKELTKTEHLHIDKKRGHFLFLSDNHRYNINLLYIEEINKFLGI